MPLIIHSSVWFTWKLIFPGEYDFPFVMDQFRLAQDSTPVINEL